MGREAPSPGEKKTILEDVGVIFTGGDDKRKAGRVKKKLHEQLIFCDGVLLDNTEKIGVADHEVAPHSYHSCS